MHHHPIPDQMAERIAALLDKAESTPYPEEAEAFLAKAQELMARHAIDDAMLDAARGSTEEVVQVEYTIAAPYASAKSALLGAVASSNRCRLVTSRRPGGRELCVLVGFDTDVRHARSLYLSLSHQAVRFMLDSPLPPGDTVRRFRHSFLLAYAHRIGERLREADADARTEAERQRWGDAEGRSVALVMASREARVDRALAEAFPRLGTRRISSSSSGGHVLGRAAADRSALDRPAVGGAGRGLPSG